MGLAINIEQLHSQKRIFPTPPKKKQGKNKKESSPLLRLSQMSR